jgi:hypothetical protein
LNDELIRRIDLDVLLRVASSSRATQRWLKTAIHTIREMPPAREDYVPPPSRPPRHVSIAEPRPLPEPERMPSDLDDLLTGKADLKEQLESHPDLAEELEGLSDIIDMLRGLGKERRKMGEDILREGMLGPAADDEEPDEDI